MEASLRILMEGLIDYAGLFPPASLGMPGAVRNYAAYAEGPRAGWLGRFVVPAARLEEFDRALAALGPGSGGKAWRLSVLIGSDLAADLRTLAEFGRKGPAARGRQAVIDCLELRAGDGEAILEAMEKAPAGMAAYFEIPVQEDPSPLLAAIARAGGRAKVRTGGVTEDAFPPPRALARFIAACARAGVAFKATAGLHHPVRSVRPLTYEPDSPRARMHGFLNVFMAAAFAADGMEEETLAAVLREESPSAFSFREGEASWRTRRLDAERLRAARRDFAISFGSCSFEEPGQDLSEAGLL